MENLNIRETVQKVIKNSKRASICFDSRYILELPIQEAPIAIELSFYNLFENLSENKFEWKLIDQHTTKVYEDKLSKHLQLMAKNIYKQQDQNTNAVESSLYFESKIFQELSTFHTQLNLDKRQNELQFKQILKDISYDIFNRYDQYIQRKNHNKELSIIQYAKSWQLRLRNLIKQNHEKIPKNQQNDISEIQQNIILREKMMKMFKMAQNQNILDIYEQIEKFLQYLYQDIVNIYQSIQMVQNQDFKNKNYGWLIQLLQQILHEFENLSISNSSINDYTSQSQNRTFLPYQNYKNQNYIEFVKGSQKPTLNQQKTKHKKSFTEQILLKNLVQQKIEEKNQSVIFSEKSHQSTSLEEKLSNLLFMIFVHLNVDITFDLLKNDSIYQNYNNYLKNFHLLTQQYQISTILKYKLKFQQINEDLTTVKFKIENKFDNLNKQKSIRRVMNKLVLFSKKKCLSLINIKNLFYNKFQIYNKNILIFADKFTAKLKNVLLKLESLQIPKKNQIFLNPQIEQHRQEQDPIQKRSHTTRESIISQREPLDRLTEQNKKLKKALKDCQNQINEQWQQIYKIFYTLQKLTSFHFEFVDYKDMDRLLKKLLDIFQPYNKNNFLYNQSNEQFEKRIKQQKNLKKGMEILEKLEKDFNDNILYRLEQLYSHFDESSAKILKYQNQFEKKQEKMEDLNTQSVIDIFKNIFQDQTEMKNLCQLTCNEFLNFKSKQKKIVLELILQSKNNQLNQIVIGKQKNKDKILKRIKSDFMITNNKFLAFYRSQNQATLYQVFLNECFENLAFLMNLDINPKKRIHKIQQQISQFIKIFKNLSFFENLETGIDRTKVFQQENYQQKISQLEQDIVKLENQNIILQDKQQVADQQADLNKSLAQELEIIKQKYQFYLNFHEKNEPKIQQYTRYINAYKKKVNQLKEKDKLQSDIIKSLKKKAGFQEEQKVPKKSMSLQKFYQQKQQQSLQKLEKKSKSKLKIPTQGKKIILKKKYDLRPKTKNILPKQKQMNIQQILSQIKSKKKNQTKEQQFDKNKLNQFFFSLVQKI